MIHFHRWIIERRDWYEQELKETEHAKLIASGPMMRCAICGKKRFWILTECWRLKE